MRICKKAFIIFVCIIITLFAFTGMTTGDTIRLGYKSDGLWHYKLNEYSNPNLYCAQEGGRLSSHYANEYETKDWASDADIFKNDDAFKKITWIKNHIWERTDKNLYTNEEILSILKSSGKNISEEDVNTVYGNQSNKFKVYQLISWRYTNGKAVNPDKYLKGSLKKVYDAIVTLAEKNYNNERNDSGDNLDIKQIGKVEETSNALKWNFKVTTNNPASIKFTVYENGKTVDDSRVTVDKNGETVTVTLNGYNENNDNTYQIIAKQPQVIASGTIYTHASTQNMILIDTKRVEKTASFTQEIEGFSGKFSLQLKKVEANSEANSNEKTISGIGFNVKGSGSSTVNIENKLTGNDGIDGILKIEENTELTKDTKEFEYEITEVENKTGNYVALKDPIKVKLIAGVAKSGDKKYLAIVDAKFVSGKTEDKVELVNGKEVKISIKTDTENNGNEGNSTITIKIENEPKQFDLALTKTITNVNYSYASKTSIYDTEHPVYINDIYKRRK